MSEIVMQGLRKSYGGLEVIRGVDLTVEKGEFMVFVGPSGCGKSTLLRLVAGLEDISGGQLLFDGVRVNDLVPSKRGIAMVFQSYALYPHMKVYDNMAFGLRLARAGPDAVIGLVTAIVAHLGRSPGDLARIRAEPGLVIPATEELLRFMSPLSLLGRVCRKPTEIGGVPVAEGQRVGLCYAKANRDPALFPDADRIVLDRRPNPHLAFGGGPHTCLGNAHARLVSRLVKEELATRAGRIEIVEEEADRVDLRHEVPDLRFARLAVRLDPA